MSTLTEERAEPWAREESGTPGLQRIRAKVTGLHCSLCTGTMEKALGRLGGVDSVAVSLTHEQVLVDYDPRAIDPEAIVGTLRDVGYDLYDPRRLRPFEEEEADLVWEGTRLLVAVAASLAAIGLTADVSGVWSLLVPASVVALMVPLSYALLRPAGRPRALAGAAAIVTPGVVALAARGSGLLAERALDAVAGLLAAGVVLGVGPHILRMAYESARRGILNQHVLLEVGAFAGISGGLLGLTGLLPGFPTAAFFAVSVLVTTYHVFSEWLSLLVKTRSSQSVKQLLDLQPQMARLVGDDGAESEVPVEQVGVGQRVRVRPGEALPLDGEVVDGRSAVKLALVTGEPVPVEVGPGDAVVGGAINGSGSLLVGVTAPGSEGFLAQVVRHVEDARALKPGILHLVDRVLRVYTPSVLAISAVSLVAWLAVGWALGDGPDLERAVFAALSVLVMGYPCAVGIAAPLAIVRGAGTAADRGIVMRTGEAFQTFRLVRRILLDKTGTLTVGRPTVVDVHAVGDKGDLLALAAAAESRSEHPLGRAVVADAARRGVSVPPVDDFEADAGSGVRARVAGQTVLVGRPGLLVEDGVDTTRLSRWVDESESAGHTVVAVTVDGEAAGAIALGDELRPDAVDAVAGMRDRGMDPVLVTGDHRQAAQRVAAALGITEVRAGVRPEQKAGILREYQADGTRVAMVGDGINDAPALMQADVGIAAGGGTDIAVESADIVLLREEVGTTLDAYDISSRAYRRTRGNVALAFAFNGVGIPLATTGLVHPVWAMVAMAASVTSIFLHSIGTRPSLLFAAISSVGRRA